MKLPNAEHERRPWRIHDLVPDFTLEDVWALPVQGGPGDFQALLDLAGSFDPSQAESRPTRFLWNLRDRLGAWLDLGEISGPVDGEDAGMLPIPGTSETSLRDRLPPDLRGTASDLTFGSLPFVPLYRTECEACPPGLGRAGGGPLPGPHGRLRQASRRLRQGLHGPDQAGPILGGVPRLNAADGAGVGWTIKYLSIR
jgi:Protein of unknown function (DUF2867)